MADPAAVPTIEIRGVAKRYGRVEALRGLDLTVHEGEVYGFLGRNGAGKSTTLRILMGITQPGSGVLRLFGEPLARDPVRLRQRIGYVAQEQNFYGWMTPLTLGRFVRGFYPTWDDAEFRRLLGALDLPVERKIQTFSGGMKAKLGLSLALAHRPPLLVLDEPTAGLDAVARREFLEMVRDQAERTRRTTLFSSHIIEEVERAADRVGIVDDGRMRYEGSLKDLSDRVRILRCAPVAASPSLLDLGAEPVVAVAPPLELIPLPPTIAAAGSGFAVLQDRVRRGERQVVVQADDPARFETVLEGAGDWRQERLGLEDIFVEMVSKPMHRSE